jgi:anti-sigma B factor antagonist
MSNIERRKTMSVKVKKEIKNDVAILVLSGSLLGGPETADKFQGELERIIKDGIKKVIIDLDKVNRMNSTGLGILMRGYMSMKNSEGDIKLVSLNESLKGILIMTQLNKIFKTYPSLEGAMNDFK